MKQLIYADNAATTKIDKPAYEAMLPWLNDEYGNASQQYSFARAPKKALAKARQVIAEAINASSGEIFFTSGGTESNNWAIKGSALIDLEKQAIITSSIEHHSVLRSCEAIARLGYPVAFINPDKDGVITPNALEESITSETRMVSVMFSNNEIGTIEPIKELAQIAHEHGAVFHTDAVQAIGHEEIDVQALGVDLLSASAHKFNGPKGIGFLYIRNGIKLAAFNDGGAQEKKLRAGTENIASIVGMAEALRSNIQCIFENKKHIASLEKQLLIGINELDFIRNGANNHIPGNISLSFKNANGEAILHRMDLMGICISTGSACDSVNTNISHVIQAIDVPEEYAAGTIRISLGKYNTQEEIERIVSALIKIIKSR